VVDAHRRARTEKWLDAQSQTAVASTHKQRATGGDASSHSKTTQQQHENKTAAAREGRRKKEGAVAQVNTRAVDGAGFRATVAWKWSDRDQEKGRQHDFQRDTSCPNDK
jgi:hypothetical protein